ncbi:RES family NAD+ phosphorylase [Flavobacterium sp. '19STA2R22 D10 B1']|uniref:RES family NAD+ phosphorylase n=1 Tax=Flavobacterium aerium TaxID=3037261 RepID=UPI00278BC4CF|nr:RES family NAD+ phosphorylase [Flavobacterium sp. '19STA2R22 D10 B1']
MKVYRLARKKYPIALSGKGAAVYGNRWNSQGIEIIYTAESRALAMAEVAVHLTIATLPSDFVMLEITIPDDITQTQLNSSELSIGWNTFPHTTYTQHLGDIFINNQTHAIIRVPSAVVKGDYNVLINPYHPEFDLIKITSQEDFPFDERLFK